MKSVSSWFLLAFAATFLLLASLVHAQNGHGIGLTWVQSPGTITGNNVYRSTSASGPFTEIYQSCPSPCTTPNPITSYTDQTGTVGVSYWYVVTAVASGQESVQSGLSNNGTGFVYPPQPPTSPVLNKQ